MNRAATRLAALAALAAAGLRLLLPAAAALAAVHARADEAMRQRAEEVVRQSFPGATAQEWAQRMEQDQSQALCSLYRNSPPPQVAEQIVARERGAIRYPDGGRLLGDWKSGEKLAAIGTGGHIGKIQPDPPDRKKGGNCYACHLLAPDEVAAGTIGPSLTAYGRLRGASPEVVQYTYEKIYNAQAYLACSLMPRFGYTGWLTPQEVADIAAYLLDPASPVNR
jgi:sulfur-oxidizing protein SoxX